MKTTQHKNFNIIIAEDYAQLSRLAAELIANQVTHKKNSVLGLATGSTAEGMYAELVRNAAGIDFSQVTAFNLDEYYPIAASNDQSYAFYMRKHFYNHVTVKNAFLPSGEAADPAVECRQYEARIADAGGIDLQVLGLGHNGHIAFNEPGDTFSQATHHVRLDESTITANARFFDKPEDVPKHALTMGIATIMHARKILLLISGGAKAEIAKKVLYGDITPRVPGSVLQLHPAVTVILDREAGELL